MHQSEVFERVPDLRNSINFSNRLMAIVSSHRVHTLIVLHVGWRGTPSLNGPSDGCAGPLTTALHGHYKVNKPQNGPFIGATLAASAESWVRSGKACRANLGLRAIGVYPLPISHEL